jgi:hypothetical protein
MAVLCRLGSVPSGIPAEDLFSSLQPTGIAEEPYMGLDR